MFETKEFRDLLKNKIEIEYRRNDMTGFDNNIVDFLQPLASNNEPILTELEAKKSPALRKGLPDALQSIEDLVGDAARYACMDGRKIITVEDVQAALKLRLCKVWPFCK